MPGVNLADDCFELALVLENKMMRYYQAMAKAYPSPPSVYGFLHSLALDEAKHIDELKRARIEANPNTWIQEPLLNVLKDLHRWDAHLNRVISLTGENFLEVYETICRIETFEVNGSFVFLTSGLMRGGNTPDLRKELIRAHLGIVEGFVKVLSRAEMKGILPVAV